MIETVLLIWFTSFFLHFVFLLLYITLNDDYNFEMKYIEFWGDIVVIERLNEDVALLIVLLFGLFTHVITIPLYIIHLQNRELEILLEELQK